MFAAEPEDMTIRMNDGKVVTRPYREAARLLSRRMADPVDPAEVPESHEEAPSAPSEPAAGPEAQGDAPVASEAPSAAPETPTLDDLSKPELVEMAREQGLTVSGTKDDLIARLSAAPEAGATPEDVPGGDSGDGDVD